MFMIQCPCLRCQPYSSIKQKVISCMYSCIDQPDHDHAWSMSLALLAHLQNVRQVGWVQAVLQPAQRAAQLNQRASLQS